MSRSARQPGAGFPPASSRRAATGTAWAVAAATALLLSGCAAGQVSQTAQQVAAIDGGNATVGHVGVRNVLVATPPAANYPQGSSAALSMVVFNAGLDGDSLIEISTPAAKSVALSAPKIPLPAQSNVTLADGGAATATLTGFTKTFCYGQSIPLTFSFEKAGRLTVNVPIETPNERTGTRETIEILPAEPTPLWMTGAAGHQESSAAESAAESAAGSAAPGAACNAASRSGGAGSGGAGSGGAGSESAPPSG